ncbi:MAG: phosphoribosyl-AMP cyclohydrolase [Candidatus Omnitrophica bacterium]|nr:phosphoribosyl-AMP cyclohydrolase [Candidatus Omnitrophota bacterium]
MTEIFENIKFDDKGLIPAVIQDERSKRVLTLSFMNREALEKTINEGKVYVYRRSSARLMMKGEMSGCIQKVKCICIDCEGNYILFKVRQVKAACHKGYFSCYFRKIDRSGRVKVVEKRIYDPKKIYNLG